MSYEIEQYKREAGFDTSKGIQRGLAFTGRHDARGPEDFLLYQLDMIGIDNDGMPWIKTPYILARHIDASPLLRYYGDSEEDREQKDAVRRQLTAEYISTINAFYELPEEAAHVEALKDNAIVDIAHNLMELAFAYSKNNENEPAFSGKLSPKDFDETGNLIKQFESEEAELAYILVLEGICGTGKTAAEIQNQQEMRQAFGITFDNAPVDEPEGSEQETLGERQERWLQIEMFGAKHEIGNKLIPELPIVKDIPSKSGTGIKRIPLVEIGYALSNGEFEQKLQSLARRHTLTAGQTPFPDSLPNHTHPSKNNYWPDTISN